MKLRVVRNHNPSPGMLCADVAGVFENSTRRRVKRVLTQFKMLPLALDVHGGYLQLCPKPLGWVRTKRQVVNTSPEPNLSRSLAQLRVRLGGWWLSSAQAATVAAVVPRVLGGKGDRRGIVLSSLCRITLSCSQPFLVAGSFSCKVCTLHVIRQQATSDA